MRAIHENRKRAGTVALAAVALAAVISPVSASSGKPPEKCPAPTQETVAVVSPQLLANLEIHETLLRSAVEARVADTIEIDYTLREAVDTGRALALLARPELYEVVRDEAVLDRAELYEVVRNEAVLDRAELYQVVRDGRVAVRAALDRYVDVVEPLQWQDDWHAFAKHEKKAATAFHPVTVGIDMLVAGAKMPARAALAAQHLVEAFAKVTPRVVRALF